MIFRTRDLKNFPFKINTRKWTLKVTYQELIGIKTTPAHTMPMW